jgi:hypothetical protein
MHAGNIEKRSKGVEKKKRKRAVPTISRAKYPLQSYFGIPKYSKCLNILNYGDIAYTVFNSLFSSLFSIILKYYMSFWMSFPHVSIISRIKAKLTSA